MEALLKVAVYDSSRFLLLGRARVGLRRCGRLVDDGWFPGHRASPGALERSVSLWGNMFANLKQGA